jgi:hypothetical protein
VGTPLAFLRPGIIDARIWFDDAAFLDVYERVEIGLRPNDSEPRVTPPCKSKGSGIAIHEPSERVTLCRLSNNAGASSSTKGPVRWEKIRLISSQRRSVFFCGERTPASRRQANDCHARARSVASVIGPGEQD